MMLSKLHKTKRLQLQQLAMPLLLGKGYGGDYEFAPWGFYATQLEDRKAYVY